MYLDRYPLAGSWRWTTSIPFTGTRTSPKPPIRRFGRAAIHRGRARLRSRRAARPCVGYIAGSHLIFGGEEWWHYGPRIRPGDRLTQKRRFHDYKVTNTKFAGPTLFSRGDTMHFNQRGDIVCKERATSIRYLAAEAEKLGSLTQSAGKAPSWTSEQIAAIDRERLDWMLSNREGRTPRFTEVRVGDRLKRRVIGPHSLASFATEYRAFIFNIWGTFRWTAPEGVKDPWINQDPGWVPGFGFDELGAKIDPRLRDGLYLGPSRGHVDADRATKIGMPRAYGYGATMGAWVTDYVAHWAGHEGFVRYSNTAFREAGVRRRYHLSRCGSGRQGRAVRVGCAVGEPVAANDQSRWRRARHWQSRCRVAALIYESGDE